METQSAKHALFDKLRNKGVFWSYHPDLKMQDLSDKLLVEHILKYGDMDDITQALQIFGQEQVKQYWQATLVDDRRFIRLNLLLARVFFKMDVEADYFDKQPYSRMEKLKSLIDEH